jgi:hypothetical protein
MPTHDTTTEPPPYRVRLDDRGRLIPPTAEQRRVRIEAARARLAELAAEPAGEPDPAEEAEFQDFLRALAENRAADRGSIEGA